MTVLVDAIGFVALTVPFLWMTRSKRLSGGWAVAAASLWWIGGLIGAGIAGAGGWPEAALGLGAAGRIIGATVGFFALWSFADVLPRRVVDGDTQVCVYRSPGPIPAPQVAAFLIEQGIGTHEEPWSVWVDADDARAAAKVLPGFIAPRLLYRGSSVDGARLLADWLQRNDVAAQVRGAERMGAVGGLPVQDAMPDVWVRGADFARATALIAVFEAGADDHDVWSCARCHDENPPAFASCWRCGASRPSA